MARCPSPLFETFPSLAQEAPGLTSPSRHPAEDSASCAVSSKSKQSTSLGAAGSLGTVDTAPCQEKLCTLQTKTLSLLPTRWHLTPQWLRRVGQTTPGTGRPTQKPVPVPVATVRVQLSQVQGQARLSRGDGNLLARWVGLRGRVTGNFPECWKSSISRWDVGFMRVFICRNSNGKQDLCISVDENYALFKNKTK